MTHNSTQLLNDLHQRTEIILQKAIGSWQMLPPEQLAKQPAPGQWSAAQCLQHLNFYGHYYLPALEKAIEMAKQRGLTCTGKFQSGWLGAYFTNLMKPQADGRLKSKMASPKNAIPAAAPDPVATLMEFIEQQEHLLQLLEAARTVDLSAIRVPISLTRLIRLRLGDTFGFVIAHHERHVLQAERSINVPLAASEAVLR